MFIISEVLCHVMRHLVVLMSLLVFGVSVESCGIVFFHVVLCLVMLVLIPVLFCVVFCGDDVFCFVESFVFCLFMLCSCLCWCQCVGVGVEPFLTKLLSFFLLPKY